MDQSAKATFLAALEASKTVCVLTGAGVSTNSGIPDFQTLDANWTFPVSRVEATSRRYLNQHPHRFWEAYKYIFDLKQARPNAFHEALAALEARGKEVTVVTQNIDGLHSAAGSTKVLEVHGNARWLVCNRPSCKNRKPIAEFLAHDELPRCEICRKFLRPDVVLFGEIPRHYEEAERATLSAGLFIVAGASLQVGPVNELPLVRDWHYPEAESVWMNKFLPPYGYRFSQQLTGDLSELAELLRENP